VAARLRRIEERLTAVIEPRRAQRTVQSLRTGPLVGTPEQIVAKLRELDGLGMAYAICYFAEVAYETDGVDLFVREVVPAFG
jgi:alkanesulfonate monooxygenase SsuD/methylene tetrahydromethanopterin reductase-like flavin-dependent oxidoreductase (luciferase family)